MATIIRLRRPGKNLALFEPIIPQTIEALQQISPAVVVPAHCTGWHATQRIAQVMPEAFVPNSVGTTFVFG